MIKPVLCGLILVGMAAAAQAQPKEPWVDLFDGKSLAGWTTLDKKPAAKGWVVEDGVLVRQDAGGDIYTQKDYANFILEFEWKIAPQGNSGVKYRMTTYDGQYLGPEYQVFDDAVKQKNAKFETGSIYELFAPNDQKKLNAVGEWNTSKIVANGTKIEHWLNGEKVVDADTATEAWKQAVAESKFKKWVDYGKSPSGRIMLQDHGSKAWYRKVRIQELP
jgi:hypothetical protein